MAKRPASARRGKQTQQQGGSNRFMPVLIGVGIVGILGFLAFLVIDATRPNEGIEGLVRYAEAAGNQHVQGDIYEPGALPPYGGPHDPIWQNCGVYDQEIRAENAVHSLEHGATWITYRADLAADEVAALQALAERENFVLLSPYPSQTSPIVLTTWAYQLEVDSAADARISEFVDRYTNDPLTTPEVGATCAGGIGDPLDR